MIKSYHFYADGKRVKELSEDEFWKIQRKSGPKMVVKDLGYALAIWKRNAFLFIYKRQLSQILGAETK